MENICYCCGKTGTYDNKGDYFHEYEDGRYYHKNCHEEYTIYLGLMECFKRDIKYKHPEVGRLDESTTFHEYFRLVNLFCSRKIILGENL